MSLSEIVSRDEWLAARKELLAEEKALTRRRDALSVKRRELPMVEISEDYRFQGPEGEVGLLDLFDGRSQLIVDHFMFDPDWDEGCPSCSADVDELSQGLVGHLHARDTSLVHVSRARLEKLEDWKRKKGWDIAWYSSHDSSFNYDFQVTIDESVAPAAYNYKTMAEHERDGTGYYFQGEQPIEMAGLSCFLRHGERVFHTYSAFGRGDEAVGGAYYWLDLTALGRQEEWELPRGRVESAHAARPDFDQGPRHPMSS